MAGGSAQQLVRARGRPGNMPFQPMGGASPHMNMGQPQWGSGQHSMFNPYAMMQRRFGLLQPPQQQQQPMQGMGGGGGFWDNPERMGYY